MSVIVVDAGALVLALVGRGRPGDDARAQLTDDEFIAPCLIDIEVASTVRWLVRGRVLTAGQGEAGLGLLRRLPFERVSQTALLSRVWELRENLTAYDASYVALAERMGAALLTTDARMARASGPRCRFRVLPNDGGRDARTEQ